MTPSYETAEIASSQMITDCLDEISPLKMKLVELDRSLGPEQLAQVLIERTLALKEISLAMIEKSILKYESRLRAKKSHLLDLERRLPVLKWVMWILYFGRTSNDIEEFCGYDNQEKELLSKLKEIENFQNTNMSISCLKKVMIEMVMLRKDVKIKMAKQKVQHLKKVSANIEEYIKLYTKGEILIEYLSSSWHVLLSFFGAGRFLFLIGLNCY